VFAGQMKGWAVGPSGYDGFAGFVCLNLIGGCWLIEMLVFGGVAIVLLMGASSVLNGRAVFANKHALALAHASGGGKCKRRVPYPRDGVERAERSGGLHKRSAED
jgi:hypothetical protein